MLLKSVTVKPAQYNSYNALGILYEATGKLAEAEAMFRKAIENYPLHTGAKERLAMVLILHANRFCANVNI
jgi:Flp pilus assembly protein TadD